MAIPSARGEKMPLDQVVANKLLVLAVCAFKKVSSLPSFGGKYEDSERSKK